VSAFPRWPHGVHNGVHDRLPEHRAYTDPWGLLVARCALLDALELTEHAVHLLATLRDQVSEPMREALTFQAIRLHLAADALSDGLHDAGGSR
jgi:hypothetical protein